MEEIRNDVVDVVNVVDVPAVVDTPVSDAPVSTGLTTGQKAGVVGVFVMAGIGLAAVAKKGYELGKKTMKKIKEKRAEKKVVATQPAPADGDEEEIVEDLGPLEESEINE